MTWENYGMWEFDHLCCVKELALGSRPNIQATFHYTNLAPMTAPANRAKAARPLVGDVLRDVQLDCGPSTKRRRT